MPLCNFSIYCFLHPSNRVNNLVPPLLHQFDCENILSVYSPDDQNPILLQFWHRNFLYVLITKRVILDGNSPRRLRGGQFPWRVHHDDIKVTLGKLQLFLDELVEVEIGHIGTNRHRILTHIRLLACVKPFLLFNSPCSFRNCDLYCFNFLLTVYNNCDNSPLFSGRRSTTSSLLKMSDSDSASSLLYSKSWFRVGLEAGRKRLRVHPLSESSSSWRSSSSRS